VSPSPSLEPRLAPGVHYEVQSYLFHT
jgi:hypothetical protein